MSLQQILTTVVTKIVVDKSTKKSATGCNTDILALSCIYIFVKIIMNVLHKDGKDEICVEPIFWEHVEEVHKFKPKYRKV